LNREYDALRNSIISRLEQHHLLTVVLKTQQDKDRMRDALMKDHSILAIPGAIRNLSLANLERVLCDIGRRAGSDARAKATIAMKDIDTKRSPSTQRRAEHELISPIISPIDPPLNDARNEQTHRSEDRTLANRPATTLRPVDDRLVSRTIYTVNDDDNMESVCGAIDIASDGLTAKPTDVHHLNFERWKSTIVEDGIYSPTIDEIFSRMRLRDISITRHWHATLREGMEERTHFYFSIRKNKHRKYRLNLFSLDVAVANRSTAPTAGPLSPRRTRHQQIQSKRPWLDDSE
jgi:hypothetical protein